MWKKTLALLLVLAMLVSYMPQIAFTVSAADEETTVSVVNAVYDADGTSDCLLTQQVGTNTFGAKWDRDNLYLTFSEAITGTVTLNEVAFPVTGAAEVQIPLANAGVYMSAYDQSYALTVTVGEASWTGNVHFDSYTGTAFVTY